jgi:hypothetical protein
MVAFPFHRRGSPPIAHLCMEAAVLMAVEVPLDLVAVVLDDLVGRLGDNDSLVLGLLFGLGLGCRSDGSLLVVGNGDGRSRRGA